MNNSVIKSIEESHSGSPDVFNNSPPAPLDTKESEYNNDVMDVDSPDTNEKKSVLRSLSDAFEGNLQSILTRLTDCQGTLSNLYAYEKEVLGMETDSEAELDARDLRLRRLRSDIAYCKEQLEDTSQLYDSTLQRLNKSKQSTSWSVPVMRERTHRDIDTKLLPVFDVKPIPITDSALSSSSETDHSLDSFLRQFERVYLNCDVDVEKHWQFHLEACFEKNNAHYIWYIRSIRTPYNKRGIKFSWSDAKYILNNRFNITAHATRHSLNLALMNLKQLNNEPLGDYINRCCQYSASECPLYGINLHQFLVHQGVSRHGL